MPIMASSLDILRLLSVGVRKARSVPDARPPPAPTTSVRQSNAASVPISTGKRRRPSNLDDNNELGSGTDGSDPQDDDDDDDGGIAMFAGGGSASAPAGRRPRADSGAGDKHAAAADSEAARKAAIRAFCKRLKIRLAGVDAPDPIARFVELEHPVTELLSHTAPGRSAVRLLTGQTGGAGHHASDVVPAAVLSRDAVVVRTLLANIEESKFKEPTPIQMACLPVLLHGRDVLGIAPTGSGKTAAFVLPLLRALQGQDRHASQFGPRAIILTPVKELAHQTARVIQQLGDKLGLRVCVYRRSVASGAGGGSVSAVKDASDLVRVHATAKQKQKKWRGKTTERPDAARSSDTEVSADGSTDDGNGGDTDAASGSDSDSDSDASSDSPPAPHDATMAGLHYIVPGLPHADILVTTPLILVATIRHAIAEAKRHGAASDCAAILPALKFLVYDEADKLLELGFLEQVDEVLSVRPTPESLVQFLTERGVSSDLAAVNASVHCGLFSATMPSGIEQLAMTVLRDPIRVTIGTRGGTASTVAQELLFVGREDGKLLAVKQIIARGFLPPALIFVQSKERAIELHKALQLDGVNVDVIHADKSATAREDIIRRFREGTTWMLITTDLLGRGMDFKGVSLVINFDFPQSAVSYVHRIGRTGRAGRAGRAVTLFTEDDISMLRSIANVMRISGCDVPGWMLELKPMSRKDKKKLSKHAPDRRPIWKHRAAGKSGSKLHATASAASGK